MKRIFSTAIRSVYKLVMVAAVLSCAISSLAQDVSSAFDAANKLYEGNKFAAAAAAYEKLAQSGTTSAALYFNLGNALFKSGQIGRAIAAFSRARQLDPRDSEIRANLRFARNQTTGPTLAPSRAQIWLGRLSLNEWSFLASGAIWIWLLILTATQWRPALKDTLRNYAIAFGIASVVACCCLGTAIYERRAVQNAIVIAHDVRVHNGPLEESPTAFTVQDGAELRIEDQKDDWLQVTPGPGRLGWVRRDHVVVASAL